MKIGMKIGVFSVVGAAVVVCAAFFFFGGPDSSPPDANEATAQETADYLVSEEFVKMGKGDKEEYLEQINERYTDTPVLSLLSNSSLSEQQRQQLMANILPIIGPGIDKRIDEFENMPAEQQQVRLDAIIDRLEEYRKVNPQAMFSPERFNLMLQYVDPHTRARLREHIPAMRQRMAERGIPVGDGPF
ncbi:MAG: hypothetical protein JXN61_08890 [Sedimentisphaerales bacterium]|nr:hypothetical protein [Sedimentisphaerales bacterium]